MGRRKITAILLVLFLASCGAVLANEGVLNDLIGNSSGDGNIPIVTIAGDDDENGANVENEGPEGNEGSGKNKDWEEDGGPPPWAPKHARERWEWSQSGEEGPPPWAPKHARERWEWSQEGDDGPPPWAPEHARERWEWSQSGEEGPPPWANGNGKKAKGDTGNTNVNDNSNNNGR